MKTLTILLVDDDTDDHEFFSMAVSMLNADISLLKAENGQQAFDLLKEATLLPDYVFLDLNMPAVDGKQFLQMIKADPVLNDLHVIVYTTSSNQEDIKETLELGAKHFITKPDTIDGIVSKISTYIGQ